MKLQKISIIFFFAVFILNHSSVKAHRGICENEQFIKLKCEGKKEKYFDCSVHYRNKMPSEVVCKIYSNDLGWRLVDKEAYIERLFLDTHLNITSYEVLELLGTKVSNHEVDMLAEKLPNTQDKISPESTLPYKNNITLKHQYFQCQKPDGDTSYNINENCLIENGTQSFEELSESILFNPRAWETWRIAKSFYLTESCKFENIETIREETTRNTDPQYSFNEFEIYEQSVDGSQKKVRYDVSYSNKTKNKDRNIIGQLLTRSISEKDYETLYNTDELIIRVFDNNRRYPMTTLIIKDKGLDTIPEYVYQITKNGSLEIWGKKPDAPVPQKWLDLYKEVRLGLVKAIERHEDKK